MQNVSESLQEGHCYWAARDDQYNVLLAGSEMRDPERIGGREGFQLRSQEAWRFCDRNLQDLFSGSSVRADLPSGGYCREPQCPGARGASGNQALSCHLWFSSGLTDLSESVYGD